MNENENEKLFSLFVVLKKRAALFVLRKSGKASFERSASFVYRHFNLLFLFTSRISSNQSKKTILLIKNFYELFENI